MNNPRLRPLKGVKLSIKTVSKTDQFGPTSSGWVGLISGLPLKPKNLVLLSLQEKPQLPRFIGPFQGSSLP